MLKPLCCKGINLLILLDRNYQHQGDLRPEAKFCNPPFPFQGEGEGVRQEKFYKILLQEHFR
ncbi:MAG: hypothetical protein KDC66_15535, partial [Phaeodactylibacter sp.]|nr:hypothetical protein [Phaeodactylibacter sp.]